MSVLPISAIKVGDRSRKDFGDIAGLADSIRTLGLLNPVVVDANHNLVAGDRRIAAFKSLGLTEIPVTVIATLDDARLALAAERDLPKSRSAIRHWERHSCPKHNAA